MTRLANLRGRFTCKIFNHLLAPVRELDLRADGELHLDVSSPAPFLMDRVAGLGAATHWSGIILTLLALEVVA